MVSYFLYHQELWKKEDGDVRKIVNIVQNSVNCILENTIL